MYLLQKRQHLILFKHRHCLCRASNNLYVFSKKLNMLPLVSSMVHWAPSGNEFFNIRCDTVTGLSFRISAAIVPVSLHWSLGHGALWTQFIVPPEGALPTFMFYRHPPENVLQLSSNICNYWTTCALYCGWSVLTGWISTGTLIFRRPSPATW